MLSHRARTGAMTVVGLRRCPVQSMRGRGRRPAAGADIAESAARLSASCRLKLPNAVQAASALAINADALVTHDRDFRRVRWLRITS